MELAYSAAEIAFRDEVRAFLAEAVPPETRRKLVECRPLSKDDIVGWGKILHAKGWATPKWPVAYGGCDWSPIQQYIFAEETLAAPAPEPLAFGVSMVGPVIYTFGSEAQKARHLPGIRAHDAWWCQGFSEPGAGSDLASLTTTARREGDVYVVDGQKTWTTYAQHADWIFCLVRTDRDAPRPQTGISFLLIDMTSPGIEVRPIQTLDGGVEINEVFLDAVRVPAENLVGEENKGWDYAKFLLGNERVGIARIGVSKARLRRVRALAAAAGLADEARFRDRLAEIEIELKALEITQMRVLSSEAAQGPRATPNPASSILKIRGSELQQAITELLMDVVGPYAAPRAPELAGWNEPPIGPAGADAVAPLYFNMRKVSIYGGTNEIQKNIIAKAVLGL